MLPPRKLAESVSHVMGLRWQISFSKKSFVPRRFPDSDFPNTNLRLESSFHDIFRLLFFHPHLRNKQPNAHGYRQIRECQAGNWGAAFFSNNKIDCRPMKGSLFMVIVQDSSSDIQTTTDSMTIRHDDDIQSQLFPFLTPTPYGRIHQFSWLPTAPVMMMMIAWLLDVCLRLDWLTFTDVAPFILP